MSFKKKLILYGVSSALLSIVLFGAYLFWWGNKHETETSKEIYSLIIKHDKSRVKTIVDAMVRKYTSLIKSGLNKEELRKRIISDTEAVWNGGGSCIFVMRKDGTIISFPSHPQLKGRNVYQYRTANGEYIFKKIIELSRGSGSGFVKCYWRNQNGSPELKIAYISTIPSLNWIVGSGFAVKNATSEAALYTGVVHSEMVKFYYLSGIMALVVLILVTLTGYKISDILMKPLTIMARNLKELESGDGDLTKRVILHSKDELKNLPTGSTIS